MLELISSLLTLRILLVGVVTGLCVYWVMKKFKYRLAPGPFALPLIGNFLQFKNKMLHEQFYDWSLKYGPVISVYIGPIYAVVVNDLETAMEVLVKKGGDFANRMSLPSVDVFTDGGKDIILAQYGATWKLHRRIAVKALRHYMMGQALEDRVHDAMSTAILELKKHSEPFDPDNIVNFIVGNMLSGLCFGSKYKYNDPELLRVMKLDDDINKLFNGTTVLEDAVPGLQYLWESGKMRQLKSMKKEFVDEYIGTKFQEHKDSFNKGNIRDFADTLILARQEAAEDPSETDVEKLSDTHLMQTISDIFFAGVDTSRLTLRYALLHMVAFPEIQAKVQEEIDKVVGFDDMPRISHRPELGYTEAVLHESMRLASVAPSGLPHYTSCDTTIAGYDVPKNTNVIINHWALHYDPKKWENVMEFKPERYLDEDGKLGPKPENWLPFSAGRRVCLGEMVAKPELLLIFACLMQRFKWSLEKGKTVDLSPDGSWFGLEPKPHQMIITDRKPE